MGSINKSVADDTFSNRKCEYIFTSCCGDGWPLCITDTAHGPWTGFFLLNAGAVFEILMMCWLSYCKLLVPHSILRWECIVLKIDRFYSAGHRMLTNFRSPSETTYPFAITLICIEFHSHITIYAPRLSLRLSISQPLYTSDSTDANFVATRVIMSITSWLPWPFCANTGDNRR